MSSTISPQKQSALKAQINLGFSKTSALSNALSVLEKLTQAAAMMRWAKHPLPNLQTQGEYDRHDLQKKSCNDLPRFLLQTQNNLYEITGELKRAIDVVQSEQSQLSDEENASLKTLQLMLSITESLTVAAQNEATGRFGFTSSLGELLKPDSDSELVQKIPVDHTKLFLSDKALQGTLNQTVGKFEQFIEETTRYINLTATATMINGVFSHIILNGFDEIKGSAQIMIELSEKLDKASQWADYALGLLGTEFHALHNSLAAKQRTLKPDEFANAMKLLEDMKLQTSSLYHRIHLHLETHKPSLQSSVQGLKSALSTKESTDWSLLNGVFSWSLEKLGLGTPPAASASASAAAASESVKSPDFDQIDQNLQEIINDIIPKVPTDKNATSSSEDEDDGISVGAASASYMAALHNGKAKENPIICHTLMIMEYIDQNMAPNIWHVFKEDIITLFYNNNIERTKKLFSNAINNDAIAPVLQNNKQDLFKLLQKMLMKCCKDQPLENVLTSFNGVQNPLSEELSQQVRNLIIEMERLVTLGTNPAAMSEQEFLAKMATKALASQNLDAQLLALAAVVLLQSSTVE